MSLRRAALTLVMARLVWAVVLLFGVALLPRRVGATWWSVLPDFAWVGPLFQGGTLDALAGIASGSGTAGSPLFEALAFTAGAWLGLPAAILLLAEASVLVAVVLELATLPAGERPAGLRRALLHPGVLLAWLVPPVALALASLVGAGVAQRRDRLGGALAFSVLAASAVPASGLALVCAAVAAKGGRLGLRAALAAGAFAGLTGAALLGCPAWPVLPGWRSATGLDGLVAPFLGALVLAWGASLVRSADTRFRGALLTALGGGALMGGGWLAFVAPSFAREPSGPRAFSEGATWAAALGAALLTLALASGSP